MVIAMIKKENKEVVINGLDHYGRGIARIENKIVFIPNSLPGEVVETKITYIKKNYMEGQVVKIINKSKSRIELKCPCFEECGGCDLMHMQYKDQLLYKETKVKEIVNKFTNIDISCVSNIVMSDDEFNYRNKVSFQINDKIGFYKKKSYEIIDVDYCLISDDSINEIMLTIKENISFENIKQIVIRSSKYEKDTMVIFNVIGKIDEKKIIEVLNKDVTSIIVKENDNYRVIAGNDHIVDKIGELKFIISPDSFFQVNTRQAKRLYDIVLELSQLQGTENILDLYCGTGTIGLYLHKHCKEVLGIEVNKHAIEDAFKNMKLNNISNINFMCGDVGKVLDNVIFKPDLVIVDPPRSGLDKKTINYLFKSKPQKIIYVSCDPVTLARDLNIMEENYLIKEIVPVDMFANTYHVECVVLMSRVENQP